MALEYHLSNDHFSVLRASVKAGCFCRDMLTHLCLNAVDVVESSAK